MDDMICVLPQGRAKALSRDQTADCEDERQRLISAGGIVQFRMDSWRVGKAGIQVSRCLILHPVFSFTSRLFLCFLSLAGCRSQSETAVADWCWAAH